MNALVRKIRRLSIWKTRMTKWKRISLMMITMIMTVLLMSLGILRQSVAYILFPDFLCGFSDYEYIAFSK